MVTKEVKPYYPVTSLPRYLVTPLPRYPVTPLPRYLVTSLPRYHNIISSQGQKQHYSKKKAILMDSLFFNKR
jgi:hypothetical protein